MRLPDKVNTPPPISTMKPSPTLLRLALAASVLCLAGCPKKPDRPTADMTPIGSGGTGGGGGTRGPGGQQGPLTNEIIVIQPSSGSGIGDKPAIDPNTQPVRGVLASVLFAFDSSVVSSTETEKLQAAAKYLTDNPNARLVLEGHCDWRGTSEYNLALGDRRALAVKKFLETLRVPAGRLETISKGSVSAKEKGATEAEMANDRRVEFVIVKAAAPAAVVSGGS
jgi:peptidoglycan-associated lipoprotein